MEDLIQRYNGIFIGEKLTFTDKKTKKQYNSAVWRRKNKDKTRTYENNRRKNNEKYRLSLNFRLKIRSIYLSKRKNNVYESLISCTRGEFKNYINWCLLQIGYKSEDYGKIWSFDHIIPLIYFDFSIPGAIEYANHWSNIQPIHKKINSIKGGKIWLNIQ